MTTPDATERIQLRNHVRDVFRGLSNRTPILGLIFTNIGLEPYFDQWMHDLQPLPVVRLAAHVAMKFIHRITDVAALRFAVSAYPDEVADQVIGEALKRAVFEPHKFSCEEDEYERIIDFHWEKLAEITAKCGIEEKLRRPSEEFGRPEKKMRAFVAAAIECTAPGTLFFQLSKVALLEKKQLLSLESLKLNELDATIHRYRKHPESIPPDGVNKLKKQIDATCDLIELGNAAYLPDSDPRLQEQVGTNGWSVVAAFASILNTWLKSCFSRQLQEAMKLATIQAGLAEQIYGRSQPIQTVPDSDEGQDLIDSKQLSAFLTEHLAIQQQQFDQRLKDEKARWASDARQRRRKREKRNAAEVQSESVVDGAQMQESKLATTAAPQQKKLHRHRQAARRDIIDEFSTLGPAIVKPVRITWLERLLETHLHAASRQSRITEISDAFRDHVIKLRLREQLKARYLKDQMVFEDDHPLREFRVRMRRLLRYNLDLEEFEENAKALHRWLDEFAAKAGHLRDDKEKLQELREREQELDDQAARDGIPQELVAARKRFLHRREKRKAKESTPSRSQDLST